MRYLILLFAVVLFSCESHEFDLDKRQIMAKDEIRGKLRQRRSFDVTSFKEDTLQSYSNSNYKRPIRYILDFVYKDSTGTLQQKRGEVLFTPDGNSILSSQIIERN